MNANKTLVKIADLLTVLIDLDDGSFNKQEHDYLFSMRCRIEGMIADQGEDD